MSDEEEMSREDCELEAELKRMMPSPLQVDFIEQLERDREKLHSTANPGKQRSKWMIPTLAVCTVVFCGSTFWKIYSASSARDMVTVDPATAESVARENDFVPVSSEGYLINAASGGIIEAEDGPRELFDLRYEDFHHWHNPDTATSIRIFSPRREVITIPVLTD